MARELQRTKYNLFVYNKRLRTLGILVHNLDLESLNKFAQGWRGIIMQSAFYSGVRQMPGHCLSGYYGSIMEKQSQRTQLWQLRYTSKRRMRGFPLCRTVSEIDTRKASELKFAIQCIRGVPRSGTSRVCHGTI
jgi:hypothetical protein